MAGPGPSGVMQSSGSLARWTGPWMIAGGISSALAGTGLYAFWPLLDGFVRRIAGRRSHFYSESCPEVTRSRTGVEPGHKSAVYPDCVEGLRLIYSGWHCCRRSVVTSLRIFLLRRMICPCCRCRAAAGWPCGGTLFSILMVLLAMATPRLPNAGGGASASFCLVVLSGLIIPFAEAPGSSPYRFVALIVAGRFCRWDLAAFWEKRPWVAIHFPSRKGRIFPGGIRCW